jgi:lipopolysaccharide O-acetyltransferase
MLRVCYNYLIVNGLKGFGYVLKRTFMFIPMKVWSSRFKKCGNNLYIEKTIKIFNPKYIELGNRFRLFYGARIECIDKYGEKSFEPKLIIGNNVTINNFVHIGVINEIVIEDNVLLASKVYITDHNHGIYEGNLQSSPDIPPSFREVYSPGGVRIKKNVWIGENVTILPNVTIGEGSIIGANSVVTKNISEYSIAVGSPARVIKKYDFKIKKWVSVNE